MRLLLYSALLSCASGVTWHVGNTGQSCDYTCTQLNPSKSCALGSFSSASPSPRRDGLARDADLAHFLAADRDDVPDVAERRRGAGESVKNTKRGHCEVPAASQPARIRGQ